MSSKKKSLYHKLSAAAQIPEDLADGAVLVTMTGQEEVCVENYKGIIEYTSSRLMLQTKIASWKYRESTCIFPTTQEKR